MTNTHKMSHGKRWVDDIPNMVFGPFVESKFLSLRHTISTMLRLACVVLGVLPMLLAASPPVPAQAFANLKEALVDYSKSDTEPNKACETLGKFSSKDIAEISTMVVAASEAAPAHCRVSGLLAPEIAFEG